MSRRVNRPVLVHKTKETKAGVEVLDSRTFAAGEEVPSDWAKFVSNDKVWADDDAADTGSGRQPAQRDPGTPPPMSGLGSDEQSWRLYAAEVEVDVDAAKNRTEVVEAIKAAGKPTERNGE